MTPADKSAAPVQAIGRALDIMLCLAGADSELSATEIARRLGLHKSTTHRIAAYLAARGFLTQSRLTSKYRLGMHLVELGSLALRRIDLRREARPHLKGLAAQTQESVFMAVRNGASAVYIDVAESPHAAMLTVYPGRHVPLHCTATGKALLIYLPDGEIDALLAQTNLRRFTPHTIIDPSLLKAQLASFRRQGYSLDDEEHQQGLAGVGAPVFDGSGAVTAAISVGGPPQRISPRLADIAAQVTATAKAISACLGFGASPPAVIADIPTPHCNADPALSQ